MNYVLVFENQKITLYANLFFYKNHPIKNVRFCWISIKFSI